MRILIKYPTRGRPRQFLLTLEGWLCRVRAPENVRVLVSYDADDDSMSPDIIAAVQKAHPTATLVRGASRTKIEACNADLPTYAAPWDVVLLVSDDMLCNCDGWDVRLRELMCLHFPDTNGALWFYDGRQRSMNTIECVGRKRYACFGYLYHPAYRSFQCDTETTEVGLRDKALSYIEPGICVHEHPSMGGRMPVDMTYLKNNAWFRHDCDVYLARKAAGFPR
jgi:hypothetical protein